MENREKVRDKCRTVAVISGKGGVGKTTLISNLGALLATKHKHILFIDLDYQANLTSCFHNLTPDQIRKSSVIRAYKHDSKDIGTPFPKDFKPAHVNKYVDILTSTPELNNVSYIMRGKPSYANFVIMHIFRTLKLRDKYDYILMDCHNSFSMLSKGALVEADKIITPVTPSRFGISAVKTLMRSLNSLSKSLINPINGKKFIHAGTPLFVGNMIDFNTKESHDFEDLVKSTPLFVAGFHRRVLFSRATTNYSSVFKVALEDEIKRHRPNNQKAIDKEIKPQFEKIIQAINK